jgi:hypothetical protein
VSPEGLQCGACATPDSGQEGRRARLLIEVFRAAAPPEPFQLERATFHRSALAERVQDILAAVSYASGFAGQRPVVLSCRDRAVAWCLLALAAAPPSVRLEASESSRDRIPQSLSEYLKQPGIAYAGGLSAVLRLAARGARPAEAAVTMGK